MTDYKALYYYLFNQITDVIKMLEQGDYEKATFTLVQAQQHTEELFLDLEL